jgi:GNAT superfamily N-acetyltransferase
MTYMPCPLEIEQATLTAVPAPRLMFDGPFVVRAFLGGTGRANAACGLDPARDPELPARIARIQAFYARLGLPCRFRSTPLDPEGLTAHLAAEGWRTHEESLVIGGRLADFARPDAETLALDRPIETWTAVMASAEHQVPARQAEKARMPELLGAPAAWMLLYHEGRPAACCFAVATGRLVGLFDLAVRPEFRRRGLGQRVMAAGGAWGAAQGAAFAYAQVSCRNHASIALNAGLGLIERYRYSYYLPG